VRSQVLIVYACAALHNFINIHSTTAELVLEEAELDSEQPSNSRISGEVGIEVVGSSLDANIRRNQLAERMWEEYSRQQ
jgi:hypothetical protein